MITEIRLPRLNANDTTVRLVAWLAADGAKVSKGDVVCAVETTKASAELEAERSGTLRRGAVAGEDLDVGALIAWIGDSAEELRGLSAEPPAGGRPVVTQKARRLAARLGIDVERIAAPGAMVRERDVLAAAGKEGPDPFDPAALRGAVDPAFLARIQSDTAFAALSSGEKIAAYRAHGAAIGEGVVIGAGSIILASHLELKDEAAIGRNCRIEAGSFSLGRMSILGDGAGVTARHVRIGDVLYGGERILIGGGGARGAASRLVVGNLCLISHDCILNPAGGIRMGDEVGLSPHVKLYTHNFWQSVLDGYHANFGPIVIEDRAYLTGDSLVVPGVRIGEGATVLANSTVSADVPPYTLVSGNPARPVGRIDTRVSPERRERILLGLMEEMKEELAGRLPEGAVRYAKEIDLADAALAGIVLTFACRGDRAALRGRCVVFDLGAREVIGEQGAHSDEVRNFLRRRGIRLKPIHWRYRGPQETPHA